MMTIMKGLCSSALVVVLGSYGGGAIAPLALAQLPPIYADDPVEVVPRQAIATFPANTFLESIAVAPDGTLFISSHEDGKILRLMPGGGPTVFASIPGKATGLAFTDTGMLLVTAWDTDNVPTIFQLDREGNAAPLMTLPDAVFLNGLTQLEGDRYLVADSYRGAIWEIDIMAQSARIWLEDPLLARQGSDRPTPGVNGLKIFDGTLYASNSDKAHLVKIPIQPDGTAGAPSLFLEGVQIDDFAFDGDGNLYGATHVYNSVIRVDPQGGITTLAEDIVGSTAVAFGRSPADQAVLYVVTNGGMFFPPPTGVVPAEVARLEVGASGMAR